MGFGLVRRDGGEHAAHAKRFIAELGTQPVLAARRGVAFVENEVDDLQHRGEPLGELLAARGLIGQPRFRKGPLGAHDALGDRRVRQQEGPGDLLGRQAADHSQRQGRAGLARQTRVTGGEDEPKQLVADVVVQGGVQIGHGLLLLLHVPGDHLVLALEHPAAAQMIQGPALGGRHQPGAGFFRNACRGPPLEGGQQGFLRQILGQRHVAQHPRQAGDQPGLLDPPDGEDRAMGVGGRHGRRRRGRASRLKGPRANARSSHVPSQPGMRSLWSCMNSFADATASSLPGSSKIA